jgi:hypothetical protein
MPFDDEHSRGRFTDRQGRASARLIAGPALPVVILGAVPAVAAHLVCALVEKA